MRTTKNGLVPDGHGWFVMNARESRWRDGGHLGVYCTFEGRQRFRQIGINLNVLQPGQPDGDVPPRKRPGGVSRTRR
jgi:hypothetical protein